MKKPNAVVAAVTKRLSATWHESVAANGTDEHWPHDVLLGLPTREDALAREWFDGLMEQAVRWQAWAERSPASVCLRFTTRRIAGTIQTLPTHLTVSSVHAAATLAGSEWTRRLAAGADRLRLLQGAFPHAATGKFIRAADCFSDDDFRLLLATAAWFRDNPGSGLTPRQVPVLGLHTKWLDHKARRELVLGLARLDSLGLNEVRPNPVHFTYLDPEHLATGGRRYDSVVAGDRMTPAFRPQVVLISENKDTAVSFPPVKAGIAMEGGGNAGPARLEEIKRVEWLAGAPRVIYWGDIDAAGFEILNNYRSRGIEVETIMMDLDTLRRYGALAVTVDARGKPLPRAERKPLEHLTVAEHAAYEMVISPDGWYPHRAQAVRLEQERIPVTDAVETLHATTGGAMRSTGGHATTL